jgi:hypothetical protein
LKDISNARARRVKYKLMTRLHDPYLAMPASLWVSF